MTNLIGKLKDLVGLGTPEGYDDYYDEISSSDDYQALYQDQHSQPAMSDHIETHQPIAEPETRTPSPTGSMGSAMNNSMNNVVGMPGASKWWGTVAEVIVMEPQAFEEMPQVIQALRERKSIVLNLTMMDPEQAQRAVDFVAGATYTIDGHQERIGESIFLFTPNCVQVSTQAGVVHEAPQPQAHPTRTPTPIWNSDPIVTQRVAQ